LNNLKLFLLILNYNFIYIMVNSYEVSLLSLCYINTIDNINRLNINIRNIERNVASINTTIDSILLRFNVKNIDELVNLNNRLINLKNSL
jgi:hypothetical protein